MIVIEDKGQQNKKHELKHLYFEGNGIYWSRYPLPVGDYILGTPEVLDVIARKQKRGMDPKKMDFLGSYNVCVDTKKDMQEIIGNVCSKEHGRFRDECILAQKNNIQLYILVENLDEVKNIEDVPGWQNPRMKRYQQIQYMHSIGKWKSVPLPKAPPTSGKTLAKVMRTMEEEYGVKFVFCTPEKAGENIIKLLAAQEG